VRFSLVFVSIDNTDFVQNKSTRKDRIFERIAILQPQNPASNIITIIKLGIMRSILLLLLFSSLALSSEVPSDGPSLIPSDTHSQLPSDLPSMTPTWKSSNLEGDQSSEEPTAATVTSKEPSPSPFDDSSHAALEPFLVDYGGDPPAEKQLPLGLCQGDCDHDDQCLPHLYCFQRNENETVPGCRGGLMDRSKTDYCVYNETYWLGECEGHCTGHGDCAPGLYCVPRDAFSSAPGCSDGMGNETTNVCVTAPLGKLLSYGANPPIERKPLGACQGDCDTDTDCQEGLMCHQRSELGHVPGCLGGDKDGSKTDYCIVPPPAPPPYWLPTPPPGTITYYPGNLTTFKDGLLLSEGLDSKELALSGNPVNYHNGQQSSIEFHGRPDGAATFRDKRPWNDGGWVYASNSEMPETGKGGVGALTFDKDGHLIDYQMVLEQSTNNCGGGPTPWNTWISCEEAEGVGRIFQVDPFGVRQAQETTMGGPRGRFEAFAYDVREPAQPRFFATEDRENGALTRFTPSTPNWNNKWDILHGPGVIDYLLLTPDVNETDIGTFTWTTDRTLAKNNAKNYYPFTEGIDTHENELFFICKKLYKLYILNLDDDTYTRTTTKSGLFNGKPDQLQRIIGDPRDMLYFAEEGGLNSGVHARDDAGRFYTILESPVNPGETTGVAFSPNGMFLYVAYQEIGKLYTVWRRDGQPFQATRFDVKYHET
jgi:hypothetical protein